MAMSAQSGPLHEWSVVEIARAVATGPVTPSEVADAFLARIDALEPRVLAWSYLDREDIHKQAAALTAEARAGSLRGPLHGVPVGIKDEFHVQGQPTGMRGEGAPREPEDATPVARLRAAGAIIMGKTYMPVGTRTPPTRNPWNLEHTPGGSSSGSGAAVGARMVPVALGEQTIGSNLRPAAYCGVGALKPSFGRVSRYGCYPFTWTLDHPGIIGRSMDDIALVLSIIAGPDPKDPVTLPDPAPPASLSPLARPPRIGLIRNFYPELTEPVMQEAVERGAAHLKEAGAAVQDFLLPQEFSLTWQVARIINGAEAATLNAPHLEGPWDELASTPSASSRPAAVNRALASLIPATYYLQALRVKNWLNGRLAAALADVDAVLMAVAPGPAPRGLTSTGDPSLLAPWTLLGYPAIALSVGLSPAGLPLGAQLVAPAGEDYHLLQVGKWCEDVWGTLPPPSLS